MSRTPLRTLGPLAVIACAGLFTTCTNEASGPGRRAGLALQLALPPAAQLSAFNLTIDNIQVVVVRPPNDTVFNKQFAFSTSTDNLTIQADVPLQQPTETFDVTIEMLSGTTLLFSSTQSVSLSEGSNSVAPAPPVYVGPGQNVTSLSIAPQDTTLTWGGTLPFRPTALDAQDNPVSSYYLSWSTSDPTVTISPSGVLTAPNKRGTVTVTARTWDSLTATAPVSFLPTLSGVTVVSGCGQSGSPGSQLPQPIVVRVDGSDGFGVPGVTVQFTAPTGASVATPQVVTDANGLAQTLVTLASSAGPNQFSISATGLSTVTCTQTGVGVATHLAFTTQPVNVGAGGTITPAVVVYAEDAQNQFVTTFTGGVAIALGANPGSATLSGTTPVTAVGGAAVFSDLSLDKVGTGYTLVATTSGLTSATSTTFNVTNVGGTHLVFTVQPSTVTAGVAMSPAVVVTAEDAQNNTVAPFTANITLTTGTCPVGATLSGATVAAAGGVATFSNLSIDKAGSCNLVATSPTLQNVASGGFTINAAAPATVVKISGDNQTGSGGAALAQPLVVEVRDAFANPAPSATVNWATTSGGSFAPASGPTGVNGRAQTTWTLGASAPTQGATATVGALTPASFSATANIGSPAISLSFAGIPGVGVGLTSKVYVDINQVAPVGGTTVAVSSGDLSVFTVAPASVTIAQGKTRDSVTVTGVSSGQNNLSGTASGFTTGTLQVVVQNRSISVPTTLNVPYGQTASLPIQLPAAAPAGGVTFTVVSSASGFVSVAPATATVTIPAGGQTANATLNGVLPGPATITVSNPSYVDGITTATTTASLNIVQTSASLNASFGTTITINFESNAVATSAPAPGITVTLTPSNPACLAVTSPLTIATGLVNTTATLTYGGSATLPCTTKLLAQATNLLSDSINVTVNPLPGITVNANTVGSGLQVAASGNLGASNHGGVTVSVVSRSPNLLLSTSPSTAGSDTITVFVPNNQTTFSYTLQALEGQTGTTPIEVVALAPGFATDSGTISLVQGAIDLIGVPTSTTTLSATNAIYARTGIPNSQTSPAFLTQLQNVRAGAGPLTATFSSQTPAVGLLVKAGPTSGPTETATIPALSSNSPTDTTTGGVRFQPLATGSTVVSAAITGFLSVTSAVGTTANVTQPGITVNANTVGSGLQVAASGNLGASNHGGVTVTVVSRSTNLLLSTSASTVGSDTITIFVPNNQTSFSYTLQALEGQTGTTPIEVVASAPGFATDSGTVSLVQGAIDLIGVPTSTTTLSPTNNIYARTGIPNSQTTPAFLTQLQNVRAGASALTVTFNSSIVAVGDLGKAGPSFGTSQTAQIPVLGSNSPTDTTSGGVLFRPKASGSTVVSASVTGFLSVTSATGTTANVTQPGITVNANTVGSGLQVGTSGNLGASNHGGVTVTVVSRSTNLLLSTSASTVGSDTITVFVPNNQTSFSYTLQALEGQTGTTPIQVVASAPGFSTDSGTISLVQGAIDLIGVPTSTTTLSPTNNIYARVGIPNSQTSPAFLTQLQLVRAGASALTVTFNSGTAQVGDLIKAGPLEGASQTAIIPVLGDNTPTDTTTGGVIFHPLLSGNTVISASLPGFLSPTSASTTAIVTQPGITVNAVTVGSGLQVGSSGNLGASNHGGKLVSIVSSNPAVLVSPNTTTAGSDSIAVFVPNNQTSFSYVVQGLEGQIDTVTAVITAKASGFTDGTATVTVVPPAFDVIGLPATPTAGSADVAVYVRVGIANSSYQFLTQLQAVRAGAPGPLTVTLTSNAPTTGTLVVSAGANATQQVQIAVQQTNSPTSVATGGVAFRPVAAGPVTVRTTIPGYVGTASAVTNITVQ